MAVLVNCFAMSLPLRKAREVTLLALYSLEYGDEGVDSLLMRELKVSRKHVRSCLEKAKKIYTLRHTLGGEIGVASTSYNYDRIGKIERNILHLAIYEINYEKMPRSVVIADALRLAKKFATEESGQFIHAIIEECATECV